MKIRISATALAVACALSSTTPSMAAEDSQLDPVVVTAARHQQRASEVLASVDVIDRETIERAGHSSLIELLASQPGVRVTSNGGNGANTAIFLRGGESRHSLLLVDGMRVGSVSSGQAAFEMIPLALVDRIEILRGPASALYGSEALGGVIQVFTRKGEPGFHPSAYVGYGTYDTRKLGASAAGGEGRLRYSVAVGHEQTEGFNSKPNPARVFGAQPDKDGFREDYFSATASLGLRQHDELGIAVLHTTGRNWYDTSSTANSYLDKAVSNVSAHLHAQLTDAWRSTVRLGYSEDRLRDHPSPAFPSRFDSTQTQLVWQNDIRLPVGKLMAAYEYLDQRIDSSTDFVDDHRRINAFLLGWTARLGAHNLQANLRHDDNSSFGRKTTGYLGYGYQIDSHWQVVGSVGTAFNAPTFNQLYWPDTGFGGGNPDLKPEKALSRELGLRWAAGEHSVGVTYFNNRVEDLIAGWPPANVDEARLEGVELGYSGTLFGYRVRAGVDLLDAEDENTGKQLRRRAEEAAYLGIDRTQGAWSWGLEWNGQGRRYENPSNTLTMGGYGLLDAYLHYAFAPAWRVEARANNLLDKDYEEVRGYATAGANVFVALRYSPR